MWGLIKKASEYIAPIITTDTLAEMKDACNQSILILQGKENEDTFTLQSSLELVTDFLTEEIGQQDLPCFDYISQSQFVQQIAEFLDKKLPNSQITAILKFFLYFVNTKLNTYYAQITIHRPFALVASKLEEIYTKTPDAVIQFITEVWKQSKKSPLMLEMMSFRDQNKVTYPLLDFFCTASLNPSEVGVIARECVLYIIAQNDDPNNKFDSVFVDYLMKPLYESITQFLMSTCDCVATIQFNGSTSTLLSWIDQLVMRTNTYDAGKVVEHVMELDTPRKLFSLAFLLDFFTAKNIVDPVKEIVKKQETLDLMIDSIENGKDDSIKAAIVLIKSMLLNSDLIEYILPQPNEERVDVLPFMPPSWLDQLDGSTSLDAYEEDACNRIRIVSAPVKGKDDKFFRHVSKLLARVQTLPLRTLLSVTHVIALFIAADASCIGGDLAESFEEACLSLKDVETVEHISATSHDGPELRAAILAECGKEIHATYLAHEKFVAAQSLFDDDLN